MLMHERLSWSQGSLLIGIDEVGRGPLAGPVVAAAVCFPIDHPGNAGVRDSKKVPKHEERVRLVQLIQSEALAWGLGAASVREIARDNIRRATALAMRRALQRCRAHLDDGVVTTIIVDGLRVPELQADHQALVKGDAHCHAIAAASLVAKVARDRLMQALAMRRPDYGWHTNVGYATQAHIAALRVHGRTPHHRELFCDTALGQVEMGLSS